MLGCYYPVVSVGETRLLGENTTYHRALTTFEHAPGEDSGPMRGVIENLAVLDDTPILA